MGLGAGGGSGGGSGLETGAGACAATSLEDREVDEERLRGSAWLRLRAVIAERASGAGKLPPPEVRLAAGSVLSCSLSCFLSLPGCVFKEGRPPN